MLMDAVGAWQEVLFGGVCTGGMKGTLCIPRLTRKSASCSTRQDLKELGDLLDQLLGDVLGVKLDKEVQMQGLVTGL